MVPGWLRAKVVQALTGTSVPDGGTMHWFSDMSQVLVLDLESNTCSVSVCGMVENAWPSGPETWMRPFLGTLSFTGYPGAKPGV